MKYDIATEADLTKIAARSSRTHKNGQQPTAQNNGQPKVLNIADLLALDVPDYKMLIENLSPERGACLVVGSPKSGKTLFAIQAALAVAGAKPLFDFYRILEPGPVLVVEQDDPAGAESVKMILDRSSVDVRGIPFHLAPRVPFSFGPELLRWLEGQIKTLSLRLVVLDSYTALRVTRGSGIDIVKAEYTDMTLLDELAKKTGCVLFVIHHGSKGSANMDWTEQAAGTFAMSAATEAQIHISRFKDLESNAPERLVRIRGRHIEGTELVLRFRKEHLDYEHVLEGGAALDYPLVLQLRATFGTKRFTPKELYHETGVARATANRQINRLHRADVLIKHGHGEYAMK